MNPFGQYPKASRRKPQGVGCRAQTRSASRTPGDFNELECHSPVLASRMKSASHYGENFSRSHQLGLDFLSLPFHHSPGSQDAAWESCLIYANSHP